MKPAKGTDRAPWSDDEPAVVPPGVTVTVLPPSPTPGGITAQPSEKPGWNPDDEDFCDDVYQEGGKCDA